MGSNRLPMGFESTAGAGGDFEHLWAKDRKNCQVHIVVSMDPDLCANMASLYGL